MGGDNWRGGDNSGFSSMNNIFLVILDRYPESDKKQDVTNETSVIYEFTCCTT
ncbi:MAG: hypothetical protein Phog2KO_49660 [Phototrophicaceae bacterium]